MRPTLLNPTTMQVIAAPYVRDPRLATPEAKAFAAHCMALIDQRLKELKSQ